MRFVKKILFISCILFIAIQFIRPIHNKNGQVLTNDISKVTTIPDTVMILLKNACYDCHSNNTDYPWYSNIQPMGWLITYHINQAKKELNFSDFGSYSQRRQLSKLDGIANSIKDDVMPLPSYKLMHKKSILSVHEKDLVLKWVQDGINNLSVKN